MAEKLRAAGAVILGKANLSQWANFRSSNSSNGWSAYGGQTFGAYYPGQDPSGSSSGSGVSSSIGEYEHVFEKSFRPVKRFAHALKSD